MPYTQEVADAANGVNLNKFLSRVEKFTTQTIPEKAQNEQILGSHLQEALANAKSTETTLPWASEGKEPPHGTKDEDNDEAFMG